MEKDVPPIDDTGANSPVPPPPPVGGVQTMRGDYAEAVTDEKRTLADVAMQAQENRRAAHSGAATNVVRVQRKSPTRVYALLIVVLLIASISLIAFKFFYTGEPQDPFEKFAVTSAILPNEQIGISADEFQRGFEDVMLEIATETEVQENEIVHIYFTDGPVPKKRDIDIDNPVQITDISTFFTLVSRNIPMQLNRALDQNNYVYGIYGLPGGERSQFMILKPKTYEGGFAGMLEWEDTMAEDLSLILQIDQLHVAEYQDRLMFNKDVRILNTSRGDTVILYSFVDANTILIVKDEQSFRDILTRLFQSPIL